MIYSIGDLHFDYSKQKPMGVFGENWKNHEEKIMDNWGKIVEEDDIVLIPGDISWALKLDEAYFDLKRINDLPGKKIFIKGNHDYWWQSLKQINDLGLESLFFVQNNSYNTGSIGIGGTRGWNSRDSEYFTEADEKIFRRELMRLENSLVTIEEETQLRIVMMHYPPFDMKLEPNEFVEIMKEFEVDICVYGHLHAEGHRYVVEGEMEGIDFHCVSSDYLDFKLKKLNGES